MEANKCKCDPSDLQPFGECVCGAEKLEVLQQFEWHRLNDMKLDQELLKELQQDMVVYGYCIYSKHKGKITRIDPTIKLPE